MGQELQSGVDTLDINGDGRLPYDEMRRWWFSGHRSRGGMVGFII